MAKHEFGIMQVRPENKERFDSYEPEKYRCISIDDDFIEPILGELDRVDCFWHTLQVPGKGLAYCGITLIPAQSMDKLLEILVLQDQPEYIPLITLVQQAKSEDHYIIHFGI